MVISLISIVLKKRIASLPLPTTLTNPSPISTRISFPYSRPPPVNLGHPRPRSSRAPRNHLPPVRRARLVGTSSTTIHPYSQSQRHSPAPNNHVTRTINHTPFNLFTPQTFRHSTPNQTIFPPNRPSIHPQTT